MIYFADGLEDQPDLLRDAKHIVHCVNLHDELVAALRDMDEFIARWLLGDWSDDAAGEGQASEVLKRIALILAKLEETP